MSWEWFSYKPTTPQYFSNRYDEGLTLETSAFLDFHAGNSTFINSFDKTQFLFNSHTDAAPQFLSKLEIHNMLLSAVLICVLWQLVSVLSCFFPRSLFLPWVDFWHQSLAIEALCGPWPGRTTWFLLWPWWLWSRRMDAMLESYGSCASLGNPHVKPDWKPEYQAPPKG